MFKLTNSAGKIVFQSNYELSNEDISVDDNERYLFQVCNSRWCMGDLSVELFINDSMCKKVDVNSGTTGNISFKTGIADKITVRVYPKYEIPV